MQQTTRWSPDTCGCVLEYTWDDTTTEDARVHTPAGVVTTCAAHAPVVGVAAVHAAVIRENTSRNQAIARAMQRVPKLAVTLPDGGVGLAPGVDVISTFSGSGAQRTLQLEFVGVVVTAADKTAIRAALADLPLVPTVK